MSTYTLTRNVPDETGTPRPRRFVVVAVNGPAAARMVDAHVSGSEVRPGLTYRPVVTR